MVTQKEYLVYLQSSEVIQEVFPDPWTLYQIFTAARVSYSLYKKYISKMHQVCENSTDKIKCKYDYRIKKTTDLIVKFEQLKSDCIKTKNRERCHRKFDDRILKYVNLRDRLKIALDKYNKRISTR